MYNSTPVINYKMMHELLLIIIQDSGNKNLSSSFNSIPIKDFFHFISPRFVGHVPVEDFNDGVVFSVDAE